MKRVVIVVKEIALFLVPARRLEPEATGSSHDHGRDW
jgi:hypothetical protein